MEHLDFSNDALLELAGGYGAGEHHSNSYPPFLHQSHPHSQARQTWPPLGLDTMGGGNMSQRPQNQGHEQSDLYLPTAHSQRQQAHQPHAGPSSSHTSHPVNFHTPPLDLEYANMVRNDWHYQLPHATHPHAHQHAQQYVQANIPLNMPAYGTPSFGAQLQVSPVDYMPVPPANTNYAVSAGMDNTTYMTMAGPMESMSALVYPLNEYPSDGFAVALNQAALNQHVAESIHSDGLGGSPTGTLLEIQSVSDNEWSLVSFNTNPNRHSLESFGTVSNPSQNLHIRTSSDTSSDGPHSAELSGSYEEIPPWPLSSPHDFHGSDYLDAQYIQHAHGLPISDRHHNSPSSSLGVSPTVAVHPSAYTSSSSSSDSPTSSEPTSPPHRRRKSPVDNKTTKAVIKKVVQSPRKDAVAEKKVGRRRGPLRPEQRQQAHEIRKLRACLRCKFLKKTCDKGEPCGGCKPSHARLWQVPCTRMDIKDIGYFMKDWTYDYSRHLLKNLSVNNITGFSTMERTVYITHGYGHYLPIDAREIFVRDEKCFQMDWVEHLPSLSGSDDPSEFEYETLKLSAGMAGVSPRKISEYLDRHLEQGFESYIDDYYGGTRFITEILKTAHRFYEKEQTPSIRKALKLLLAYNLTMHITMVEGISDEEQLVGKIKDPNSQWCGKTLAPVVINFQIKCAMSEIWRELQKDMLEELSTLYSSVYSGDKLKNWPTIFILAAILLVIWEEMEYDTHCRAGSDERAINKFCDDMESTPVGVIIGLFQAISTKLPGLQEWDTRKHHQFLGSNPAVCDALTEVKGHITKHEEYLRERTKGTAYNEKDQDCLSNKFLSKLVIRAN